MGKGLKAKKAMVVITNHALERFKERWRPLGEFVVKPSSDMEWRQNLEFEFRRSQELTLNKFERLHQLINYGGSEEERFFRSSDSIWRFVAIDDMNGDIPCIVIKTAIWKGRNYSPERDKS